MNITPAAAAELAAILKDPHAIVVAINDRLEQIDSLVEVLKTRYAVVRLSEKIPVTVRALNDGGLGSSVPAGPQYLPSGMTAPRADGAVRVRAWDEAIAAAVASSDEATKRWGNENAKRPWVFLQDTLTAAGITADQKLTIGSNCANARMFNGWLGGRNKGFSWPAYTFTRASGAPKQGDLIVDAWALNDDRVTLDGQVIKRGYWASDMAALASQSLLRFIMTNGAEVLTAGTFGGKP